ncbi:hypothetical protein [Microbacterium sp.]|uniref:hypothetical protein n=1 Tax=Microbacterium sp. TaxID=51671 RepID=UPI00333F8EF2
MSTAEAEGEGIGRAGWTAATAVPRSAVDVAAGAGWLVARVRAGGLRARSADIGASTCRVLIGVAGHAECDLGDEAFALRPKTMLVVSGDRALAIDADAGWAHWEWQLTSPPSGLVRARMRRPTPFDVEKGMHQLMGGMTSSLIDAPPGSDARAQTFVYRALSQVVVAVIADSLRLGSTRQRLFERAQFLIEESFADPGFSVGVLGRQLSTSRSHLYEVFAEFGTSPRQEIERRRVDSVLARFDLETLAAPALSAEVVGVSGFSSAKQLRRALVRRQTADDEGRAGG